MIDDDPKTHRWSESPGDEPSATQSDDPNATRCPDMLDPFATIADSGVMTWADTASFAVGSAPTSPGTPRFRIIKAHARGALGEVFLARDEELKREVALKEIQEAYADDACSQARFILEAEVTGGLEHPGIVPVYGLGRHPDGRPYYAMRFVRGGSLKEAIDRFHRAAAEPKSDPGDRTLEFRKLLARFLGVCNAIAYAHSRKILHRDLKPGNVMLGPYGETLVVDWGLAKSLVGNDDFDCVSDLQNPPGPLRSEEDSSPSATVMGSVVGTPAFMSPEQAEGDLDRLGPPSDIYSLGATLYYLLTGKVAFEGRDVAEILKRVREGDFPPPGRVRNDVPNALEAIALKAMALRPEDRYPNARALATDVEHWMAGASVSAYRDWYAVRVWRWFLRRPILATAGVACLFFDLCLLVILPLVYVQSVLHARGMARLNLAVGVLVLSPFVGQLGALIGSSLGALIGLASRRTLAGLKRGASVGLTFGVPTALLALLGSGAFEVARPPSWTNLASWLAPGGESGETWPRLPDALTRAPHWIKSTRAPAEIATFFDVPARDDNAAPIYLEALLEFDDGMASCFSSGEGAWRGAKALARMAQLDKVEQAWQSDPRSVDRDALDDLLDDYQVGFLKLRQAQKLHRCVFQTGFGDQVSLPHVRAAGEVERVAVLQVRRKLEQGEINLAIDDLQVVLRLFRDIRSRGVISTQKSSLALETAAETEILLPILQQTGLKGEHCERLLTILEAQATEDTDPAREGFRAEYIRFGQTLHAYLDPLIGDDHREASANGGLFGSYFTTSPSLPLDRATELKLAGFLARTPPRDFAEAAHRAYDDYHRKIQAQTGKSLPERIAHAGQLPRSHETLELAPDGAAFLKEVGKAEASRNAMKCLVAFRRWELAGHSIGPDQNLEEIVKLAGIPRVPADPFRIDGGPLQFRLDQATPVIESIGSEGQGRGTLTFRLMPAVEAR